MNFKGLMKRYDRAIEKNTQIARRNLIGVKDANIKKEVETYIDNERVKIKANKIMREERIKSGIRRCK